MKEQSTTARSTGEGRLEMGRCEGAGIGLFHNHHARVLAQFPGELALPDIDREDFGRSMLQQAIGETAR